MPPLASSSWMTSPRHGKHESPRWRRRRSFPRPWMKRKVDDKRRRVPSNSGGGGGFWLGVFVWGSPIFARNVKCFSKIMIPYSNSWFFRTKRGEKGDNVDELTFFFFFKWVVQGLDLLYYLSSDPCMNHSWIGIHVPSWHGSSGKRRCFLFEVIENGSK